jgi:Arc/MetJ-type ribon-helix-helix transcriptional regulator
MASRPKPPSRRPIYNFAIDRELLDAIRSIKVRDGISESEQIRRGIRLWLQTRRVKSITGYQVRAPRAQSRVRRTRTKGR